MDDLLPCPFCGGTADLAEDTDRPYTPWTAFCESCDASTGNCAELADAVTHWNRRAAVAALSKPEPVQEREALARAMADKLMCWKLPADFSPDCGISFKRESDYEDPEYGRTKYKPTGTNLLTHQQAVAMLLEIMPAKLSATPPAQPEPEECGANGSQGCVYGPHGPNGERQCEYCGATPLAQAGDAGDAGEPSDKERLDAARYRWLRSSTSEGPVNSGELYAVQHRVPHTDEPDVGLFDDELDAAIDAAIRAAKGGKL